MGEEKGSNKWELNKQRRNKQVKIGEMNAQNLSKGELKIMEEESFISASIDVNNKT